MRRAFARRTGPVDRWTDGARDDEDPCQAQGRRCSDRRQRSRACGACQMSRATVLFVLALIAGTAAAQTQVYRCGADGRSYSQEPCAQGRAVDVADPRSTQQAAQTRQAALRDARQADEIARARLRAERLAASQAPARIGWSKAGAADDARCANGATCKHVEPSPRRAAKPHTVTLYRPAPAR